MNDDRDRDRLIAHRRAGKDVACGHCFWWAGVSDDAFGECRFAPPVMGYFDEPDEHHGAFPLVECDRWCSSWEPCDDD